MASWGFEKVNTVPEFRNSYCVPAFPKGNHSYFTFGNPNTCPKSSQARANLQQTNLDRLGEENQKR